MAMSVREAEEMTEAARDAGVLALIDHELRFLPGRQKAYEMLRSGEIGKVHHAKYLFAAAFRGDPDHPWNWWSDIKQGGGALGAIDSHVIDSLNWFLGTEISSVFCRLETKKRRRRDRSGELRDVTADDEANMMVQFRDSELTENASGLISVSMAEPPEYKNLIELFGTAGSMRIGNFGELSIAKLGDADWTQIDVDHPKAAEGMPDTGFSRGFMKLAPKIVEAVRSGGSSIPHAATFEDGLRVQRVLDAARESDASGCMVRIS
jgi:predicted dehydrogenase